MDALEFCDSEAEFWRALGFFFSFWKTMERDNYAKELEVAVRVVHVACALCGRVQERLLSASNDHVMSKDDDSPVTIAGILH